MTSVKAISRPPKTTLSDYLDQVRLRVNRQLATDLRQATSAANAVDSAMYDLLQEISILIKRGGKRLRPTLAYLAYEGFGGQDVSAFRPVASSQEFFHAFILMHDDIIDRDSYRWGGKNISGQYFDRLSQTMPAREAMHFAEGWALLAGDVCLNLSNQLLLGSTFDPRLLIKAAQIMQQTLSIVVGGELVDVAISLEKQWPSAERLHRIYINKTAVYSFQAPLQIGALLAGADQATLERLARVAADVGLAYQLQDDLLGIFGDEQQTGKSTLSDLREGKRTLLMQYAEQAANPRQRQVLHSHLGNSNVNLDDLNAVQNVLTDCGAQTYVRQLIDDHSQRALMAIKGLGCNPLATARLAALITRLIGRSK